MKFDVVMFQES